jgi:1-aminocyclopropane-1-carboxylate deaminase/D-cysteine desulfhydrase-like pyridoxal-dependent ACC family enzyme/ribosomal protein S18 acetylase RimI-like enzyme
MNKVVITLEKSIDNKEIYDFLRIVDNQFSPSLVHQSLSEYAKKLQRNSSFIVLRRNSETLGIIPFYDNDSYKKRAFISLISLKNTMRSQGYGVQMLNFLCLHLKTNGFESLTAEMWHNSPNEKFYKNNNFMFESLIECDDTEVKLKRIRMKKWFGKIFSEHNNFYQSQLEYSSQFSTDFSINLFLKRDDLLPKFGGGNKARKLDYIIKEATRQQCNAIVTAGGAQSNHCRATALYAASLGWKSILIIHDDKPIRSEGNFKLMELAGAEIRFVNHVDVKEAMDNAMSDLEIKGYKPYYVWGGGHSLEGALAFYEAVKELRLQLGNISPDYLVVASGTGATQAGLEVGIRQFYPKCKVLGVSIARDKIRGKQEVLKSINELNAFLKNPIKTPKDIFFDTSKCGIGYESVFPELISQVRIALKKGGLVLK